MRNVFLQLVFTNSNTYSSYGHKTATYPTVRIKLERVLFLTNTATILIRPRIWLDNTYLFREKRPTASAAVGTKDTATFNARVVDYNDEIWAMEADHRTGWNKTFNSGTYRDMLYGLFCVIIRNKLAHQRNSIHCRTENRRDGIYWYVSRWI